MAARIYWIEAPWKGKLAIIPRPPGGDWLKDEVAGWHDVGINVVVSFLTPDEIAEFALEAEKELCEEQGISFISFAISDRQVPASKSETLALVQRLKQLLVKGEKVGLHCRQSVGRSALIAACLLVSVGVEPDEAFKRIGSARGGKVPDTAEQQQWVAGLEKDMSTKGERLFEAYLLSQGITDYEFEKTHQGKSTRPDFSVTLDREYLFEVKDFEPRDIFPSGAYDPFQPIRWQIVESDKKFKDYEEQPCCLALYNHNASLIHLEEPEIICGAMPQVTTISAIITLREVEVGTRKLGVYLKKLMAKTPDITPIEAYRETFSPEIDFDKHERQLGVIIWENAFARIPFPRNIFCGKFDERYILDKGHPRRIFVGSGLAALEEIEESESLLLNVP
ncbi:MAG: hypothetical protein AB1757_10955 [Acidobacteriota bacterium]